MRKIFVRKVTARTEKGIMADERLDITVDQDASTIVFGFTSRVEGVADIRGQVGLPGGMYDETELSHSSGKLTFESLTNFNAFSALLGRLETCAASGMTNQQIFNDPQIKAIFRNNNFEELNF